MRRQKFGTLVSVYGILILLLCTFIATTVHAEDKDNQEIVKVGFYQFDGYHEIVGDGTMSGAGYDFLQMISGYVNFQYEYVGYDKSWADMLQMLEDGEIDMVTSAQYTEKRAEQFDYSDYPVGYSEAILSVRNNQDKIVDGDYSTYQNMRVGMMRDSSQNEKMFRFAQKHNFTFEPVYYATLAEMKNALQEGTEIDAIVTTSIRTLGNEHVLERFERAPYYVIVKKGNTELLDKINYAINELNDDDPAWQSNLYTKYYSLNATYISLQPDEREYLETLKASGKKVEVLVNPDLRPYSYFEDGQAKGILVDYFSEICKLYKIKAHYVKTETSEEYDQYIQDKKADVVLAPNFNKYEADHDGYYLTHSFMDAQLCLITRSEMKQENDFTNKKIAVVNGMSSVLQAASKEIQNAKFIIYPTADECVQAVKEGVVSGAYLYVYSAYRYLNYDWTNEIQMMNISDNMITFSIAVPKAHGDMLYNLMCHGIRAVSDSTLQTIIAPYVLSANQVEEPLWVYIYHKPIIFTTLIGSIIVFIIFAILLAAKKRDEILKEKREKAEYEATHDPLTGAMNRGVYERLIKKTYPCSEKVGVLFLDIDYFKEINDTYGHKMGDQVLKHFVTLLQKAFRDDDLIIRMGGDEFVLILQNCEKNAWNTVCQKISTVHAELENAFPSDVTPTLSGGLCFSEKGVDDNLFKRSDAALYHTKKEGRAGCTMVDSNGIIINYWKEEKVSYAYAQVLGQQQLNMWRLVVEQDGVRKLYAQAELYEWLQISRETLPELVYDRWYQQVSDENKGIFDQMILDMQQGNTTEATISCMCANEAVRIRFGGKRVKQDKEEIFTGYYQVLNGIHIIESKKACDSKAECE